MDRLDTEIKRRKIDIRMVNNEMYKSNIHELDEENNYMNILDKEDYIESNYDLIE